VSLNIVHYLPSMIKNLFQVLDRVKKSWVIRTTAPSYLFISSISVSRA
jgi:hypothetical protein